jgi:nicotinamidase-related amidase
MTRQIRIVDVFTDRSLAGNQLAVVLDGKDLSPRLMQRIAREMNFSETTFVFPPENAAHAARIRIFTPALELPFAGHPTIGTAWVLIDEGVIPKAQNEFVLEENVGPVPVRADGAMVWMTHPKLSFGQVVPHKQVAAAIGVEESDIVLTRMHGLGPMAGTDLDPVLRNLGVRTIVGAGVSVNMGMTNFAMDAVNAGYQFVMPRDAVAGVPSQYADAVIEHTLSLIATVTTTDDILKVWQP